MSNSDVPRESDLTTDHALGPAVRPPFLAGGGRAELQPPDAGADDSVPWLGIAGYRGHVAMRSRVDHAHEAVRLTMRPLNTGSMLLNPHSQDKHQSPFARPGTHVAPVDLGSVQADGPGRQTIKGKKRA